MDRSPQLREAKQWLLQFAGNMAAAAVAPALVLMLNISTSPRDLWKTFLESAAYANVIGFSAGWAIPWLYCRGNLRRGARWEWPTIVLVLVVLSILGCLAGSAILVAGGVFPWSLYWPLVQSAIRLCIAITLAFGLVTTAFGRLRGRLDREEYERQRAQKLAAEARLSSLESRLHPHFLFNTLNSISALIPVDPRRAERLIEAVSALLRFSLDAQHRGVVPLDQELKIVRDYLEIEHARLADRLRYSVEGDASGAEVPPLAIQTLVENSIKHAIAPIPKGGELRVRVRLDEAFLHVEVLDTGGGFAMTALPEGHGLALLRDRLQVLYGAEAVLTSETREGWGAVSLKIPVRAKAMWVA